VLARVRINVADLPGTLGRVASAIGSAGADIVKVDVLESEAGRAVDDVFVTVRERVHLERVCDHLAGLAGTTVLGVQYPAPPVAGHADLELLSQVLANPERGLQTMVDGAPGALGADWAAIVVYDAVGEFDGVIATSTHAPRHDSLTVRASLRLAAIELAAAETGRLYGGAALVPLGHHPLGLLLVRETGPDFHQSELYRLEQIGLIAARVVGDALLEAPPA
jgi:hypothetical protein